MFTTCVPLGLLAQLYARHMQRLSWHSGYGYCCYLDPMIVGSSVFRLVRPRVHLPARLGYCSFLTWRVGAFRSIYVYGHACSSQSVGSSAHCFRAITLHKFTHSSHIRGEQSCSSGAAKYSHTPHLVHSIHH